MTPNPFHAAAAGIALAGLVLSATACAGPPAADGAEGSAGGDPADPDRIIAAVALENPDLAGELEAIRAATEKYRDADVALEEGYLRDPMDLCVTPEMEGLPRQLGGMGIHFFRPDLLAITQVEPRVAGVGTHEDFRQPGVLIYEPQADGSLELVAVENVIFEAGWLEAGRSGPPEFMDNQYYKMVENPRTEADEAHGFEPHYELHLWLYRENPSGLFAQFNPNVSCEHHAGGSEGHGAH